MLVTPIKRKFGKHQPGDVFELRDKTAQVLIKVGKLAEARSQTYQTRDMRVSEAFIDTTQLHVEAVNIDDAVADESDEPVDEAPWGYKADGTPRKRPGRAPSTD